MRIGLAAHFLVSLVLCVALGVGPALAQNASREEIVHQIDSLRNIKPSNDQNQNDAHNKRMDGVWTFLTDNKPASIPIVLEVLNAELTRPAADQFLLLDLGAFTLVNAKPLDSKLAERVLRRIDLADPTIRANFAQLVRFSHLAATSGDAVLLPQFDRLFLPNTRRYDAFVAPHYIKLDSTLICVFLYGIYADAGMQHLHGLLSTSPATQQRVIEILNWIGSEKSIPSVMRAIQSLPSGDMVARAIGVSMRLGGKSGQAAALSLEKLPVDEKTRLYLGQIKPSLEKQSFEQLRAALEKSGPRKSARLSPVVIEQRLAKMDANFGVDHDTHPLDIFDSTLTDAELMGRLIAIRARMFHRLNSHALDDVQVTNLLINTLQYGRPLKR